MKTSETNTDDDPILDNQNTDNEPATGSQEAGSMRFILAIVKNRFFVLGVSFACFILCWGGENLRNYGLITHGFDPDWKKDLGHFLSWMIIPYGILFPVGICLAARKWLLAEKWLLLIPKALVISVFFIFCFQNPYFDPPFYHQPLYAFLNEFCDSFVFGVVFQGIPIVLIHFVTREKDAVHSLSRKIVSAAGAILLTALILALFSYLGDMIC